MLQHWAANSGLLLSKLFREHILQMHLCKSKCESAASAWFSCMYNIPRGHLMKVMLREITAGHIGFNGKVWWVRIMLFNVFHPMHFWCRPMQKLLVLRLLKSLFQDFPISGLQNIRKTGSLCVWVEKYRRVRLCLSTILWGAHKIWSMILFCLYGDFQRHFRSKIPKKEGSTNFNISISLRVTAVYWKKAKENNECKKVKRIDSKPVGQGTLGQRSPKI